MVFGDIPLLCFFPLPVFGKVSSSSRLEGSRSRVEEFGVSPNQLKLSPPTHKLERSKQRRELKRSFLLRVAAEVSYPIHVPPEIRPEKPGHFLRSMEFPPSRSNLLLFNPHSRGSDSNLKRTTERRSGGILQLADFHFTCTY